MSSTTGAQNLLVNVFRPAYTYNTTTGLFTPTVDLANVAYSGNTISVFTAAVGDSAGNVYVGSNAGNSYTNTRSSTNNVALGYNAGELISNVANSIYIGSNAGANVSNASNVIAIGTNVGGSGTSNIFVGTSTGSTGNSNILIGHGITANSSNNLLRIGSNIYGNTSTRWVGIGTNTPTNGNNFDVSGNAKVSGTLSAGVFDVSAISAINLVVPGYVRNALTPTQFDISGGNISNSAVHTTTGLVGTYLRNALTPTQFDISGGNISNSGTVRTANALVSGYLRNALTPTQFDISGGNISNLGTITTSNIVGNATASNSLGGITLSNGTTTTANMLFSSYMRSSLPIDTFVVGVGEGTNSIAYSSNGLSWTGAGTSIFSIRGHGVAWNGTRWVAVGEGTNTLATSTNGTSWTGSGTTMFDAFGSDVAWNGSLWVAVGLGATHTIATSTDGINWTGRGKTALTTAGYGVAWNGSFWVAIGDGIDTFVTSTDGITWTGRGFSPFSVVGYGVAWNGSLWVAVGEGTHSIATSTDGINWTGRTGQTIFSTRGRKVAWNGSLWVAVGEGTNTIAYSTDGITWTGVGTSEFSSYGYGIAWNGTYWVAMGEGTNTIVTSTDGITWSSVGVPRITTSGRGVASRRYVLPLIDPTTLFDASSGNVEYTGSIIGSNAGTTNRIGGVTLSNYNISNSGTTTSTNILSSGYIRNALVPTQFDISGGNISNSGTHTTSNIVGNATASNSLGGITLSNGTTTSTNILTSGYLRNALVPTQFDISGGNIRNFGTIQTGTGYAIAVDTCDSITGFRNVRTHTGSFIGISESQYLGVSAEWPLIRSHHFSNGIWTHKSANSQGSLVFKTYNTSATAERMRLDHNGYLGIGNIGPTYNLDISAANSANTMRIQANSYPSILLSGLNDTSSGQILYDATGGGNQLMLRTTAGTPLAFQVGGAVERMRIAANGRVGIGVVNPTFILDVCSTATSQGVRVTAPNANLITQDPRNAHQLAMYSDINGQGILTGGQKIQLSTNNLSSSNFGLNIFGNMIGAGNGAPAYQLDVSAGTTTASINMTSWPRTTGSNFFYGSGSTKSTDAVIYTTNTPINSNIVTIGTNSGTYFVVNKSGIYSIVVTTVGSAGTNYSAGVDASTNIAHNATGFTNTNALVTQTVLTGATRVAFNYTGYLPAISNMYYKVKTASSLTEDSKLYITFLGETPAYSGFFI